MKEFAKRLIQSVGNAYIRQVCKREYQRQTFVGINERPVEYRFVFDSLTSVCPTSVLDVGTGKTALPHMMRNCGFVVTAIDNIKDYWPRGMVNRHFHVLHDDITSPEIAREFDFVTCVSVLEHIKDHTLAVRQLFNLLRPGGHLVLSFPYNERRYVDNVYKLPGSIGADKFPFVTQAFSRNEVDQWLEDSRATLVRQEYWRFFSGEYWTVGERVCPPIKTEKDEGHQISCMLLQKPSSQGDARGRGH